MWVPFHTDKKQPDVIGTLIIPPMQMGKLRPEKLLGVMLLVPPYGGRCPGVSSGPRRFLH